MCTLPLVAGLVKPATGHIVMFAMLRVGMQNGTGSLFQWVNRQLDALPTFVHALRQIYATFSHAWRLSIGGECLKMSGKTSVLWYDGPRR